MRGEISSCDACGTPSVDAHMPEAEGGPYDISEELSPSELGAFDGEPESADVPKRTTTRSKSPAQWPKTCARPAPEVLTLIHLIIIPVTNTSVNSVRSTGTGAVSWGMGHRATVAVLAGALSGRDSRRARQAAGGGIAASPDSAATVSDLAEAWRG
jgi:hypothetical protein